MKGLKIIVLAKQVPDTRNVGKDVHEGKMKGYKIIVLDRYIP
jgi:hypothetical protein